MTQKLINEIIDLVNEQRDSQGMITKVDLTLKIKTLLETNLKNNGVLDDVIGCTQCEIVDARNEIIESGYMCIKCNKLFKAYDH
jgi:hypothetical protein